jgi:hypothetical protein
MTKYMEKCGVGKGDRFSGTGVRLTLVAIDPSTSRITAPGGILRTTPGRRGDVTATSWVVGEVRLTACAESITGIQIVKVKDVVTPEIASAPMRNWPY